MNLRAVCFRLQGAPQSKHVKKINPFHPLISVVLCFAVDWARSVIESLILDHGNEAGHTSGRSSVESICTNKRVMADVRRRCVGDGLGR